MTQNEKSKDIASQRMQLIAPLVVDGLDRAEIIKLRREISAKSGVSERSIIRYVEAYSNGGFQALFPKSKAKPDSSSVISEEILQEAILLRREVPNRSVSDIINILEWEGLVQPGILKRSTLQTHLMKRGYSSHHLKLYNDSQSKARRFQKQHRNQLWQSDIKYGPKLPIGPNGEKIALYMVAFIDDATRFVLHSEFYTRFDQTIVEDCFRKALAKFGAPEAVYFDNGKQYRNKQMIHICSELGVKLLYTRPYSPEAKGKVERFNREVDRFLDETKLERGV
ncbi:MAG: DDE-type integrase/transposase/recombinase, partial [Turicibacter sp.]